MEDTFRKSTIFDEKGDIADEKEKEIMDSILKQEEKYGEDDLTQEEKQKDAESHNKLFKKVKYDNLKNEYNRW